MAKADEYKLAKMAPPGNNALSYPNHDRANELYAFFMSGFVEDEIAAFHGLPLEEVQKDIMYVQTRLPVRTIIAHNNDRQRVMLQREQSENFRRLMSESLGTSAATLLAAGVSPAGILKEFREATGMVQKAEPLIQVNTQINSPSSNNGGIQSAEDVIRRVLSQIKQDTPVASNDQVIDTEPVREEDQIPDDER